MEIHSVGINYIHKNGIIIDRPNGSGDNLMLMFKTPASVTTDGRTIQVAPDSAIVYARGSAQLYGNADELYVNHCVHFDTIGSDSFLQSTGLITDKPFVLSDPVRTEQILKSIALEFYSGKRNSMRSAELLLKVLLLDLGESCGGFFSYEQNNDRSVHESLMRSLRAEIYSNPSADFTVDRMAEKMNMSRSHFQRIYRQIFGVSSYEDVINARISLAEQYLATTDLTVSEIASLCGYECYEHFMRQFRLKKNTTPIRFRKSRR